MRKSEYAAKLQIEMDKLMKSFCDPGYDDFMKYREAVARVHQLRWCREQMKISTDEEDSE